MLSGAEAESALAMAARRHIPVALTLLDRNRWLTYRGDLMAVEKGRLWIRSSLENPRTAADPLALNTKVGLMFRMGPHKYNGLVQILQFAELADESGQPVKAVSVSLPSELERMERRVHDRLEVDASGKARVSFWSGGRAVEPKGPSPHRPVWGGSLVDISRQGFAVRTSWDSGQYLEVGDIIGARMLFDGHPVPVYVNAQLRHAFMEGNMGVLRFQFVGMADTDEGRNALDFMAARVDEYAKRAAS
jgi:hypothetical protein